jgi:hypothetical protein
MAATDGGMPIKVAMKATKSAGGSVSQAHDMTSKLPGTRRERDHAGPECAGGGH